jgi:HAD superfamily hydrolase (TIGR01484 family)
LSRKNTNENTFVSRSFDNGIKLIALDFDLTIYDYANPSLTLKLLPWFKKLSQAGVVVGLATGRRVDDLKYTLEEIGFPWSQPFPAFIICEEGLVMNTDGTEYSPAVEWNNWRRKQVTTTNAILKPIFELKIQEALAEGFECLEDLVTDQSGTKVVYETPKIAEIVRRTLLKAVAKIQGISIVRNHHIILGLPTGADKGSALSQLTLCNNITEDQVLAIGDNLNDLCMIDGGHSFRVATVSNAVSEIQVCVAAKGGFIASKKAPLGVMEIFDYYFEALGKSKKPEAGKAKRQIITVPKPISSNKPVAKKQI